MQSKLSLSCLVLLVSFSNVACEAETYYLNHYHFKINNKEKMFELTIYTRVDKGKFNLLFPSHLPTNCGPLKLLDYEWFWNQVDLPKNGKCLKFVAKSNNNGWKLVKKEKKD